MRLPCVQILRSAKFFVKVKIHTPWWLPDVTFRWSTTLGLPALDLLRVLAAPLIEAAAKQLSAPEPAAMPALSPVVGATIDPDAVYNFNELASASGVIPAESVAQIVPISVDSSLSLHFKVSVDDRLVFGQNTASDMGTDTSSDVSTVYELVELGIRRRPRGSTTWSTLIDPAESRMESLVGLSPEVVQQRTRQKVRFRWDADFQREGKQAPRRLLINTDAPYWATVLNFEGDELLLETTPGWPCCVGGGEAKWHTLDFNGITPGARVPATQKFSESTSTLRWVGILPPIAGPGQVASGVTSVARLSSDRTPLGTFARIVFVEIAQVFELTVRWSQLHLNRQLVVRAFRGMKQVDMKSFDLSLFSPAAVISMTSTEGISEIQLSLSRAPNPLDQASEGTIELVQMRFRSVEEELVQLLEDGRCQAAPQSYAQPGGRFAWLPNHEYEISLRSRVKASHGRIGELVREVPQTLLFYTRNLPGLNEVKRIGEEFEPYVESVYPGPGRFVYCTEPIALALNERSDIFRRPDTPLPDDPPERPATS